jgi:hypothetical protein
LLTVRHKPWGLEVERPDGQRTSFQWVEGGLQVSFSNPRTEATELVVRLRADGCVAEIEHGDPEIITVDPDQESSWLQEAEAGGFLPAALLTDKHRAARAAQLAALKAEEAPPA